MLKHLNIRAKQMVQRELKQRNRYNVHHTAYYRRAWDSMEHLRRIRADSRLQVPLELDAHAELHKNIDMIPPLPISLGLRAYSLFRDYGDAHDPVENVQNFMRSIEAAGREPRERELNRSIGENAVWAFEMQIPWIQQGYVDLAKYRAT